MSLLINTECIPIRCVPTTGWTYLEEGSAPSTQTPPPPPPPRWPLPCRPPTSLQRQTSPPVNWPHLWKHYLLPYFVCSRSVLWFAVISLWRVFAHKGSRMICRVCVTPDQKRPWPLYNRDLHHDLDKITDWTLHCRRSRSERRIKPGSPHPPEPPSQNPSLQAVCSRDQVRFTHQSLHHKIPPSRQCAAGTR